MLSDIFETFYANVRTLQYLQFILHFKSQKQKFIPILMQDVNADLKTEITNFYNENEAKNVLNIVLHSVVHNPKTYLYEINAKGSYEKLISGTSAKTDVFNNVISKLNAKKYQKIEFLNDK